MKNLNRICALGNVVADGEVSEKGQYKLLKFRMATNRSWKKSDGTYEKETTYHTVERWGAHDSISRAIVKGVPVYVEGRIANSEYVKQDGSKAYFTKIMADDIIILTGKSEARQETREDDGPNW